MLYKYYSANNCEQQQTLVKRIAQQINYFHGRFFKLISELSVFAVAVKLKETNKKMSEQNIKGNLLETFQKVLSFHSFRYLFTKYMMTKEAGVSIMFRRNMFMYRFPARLPTPNVRP